MDPFLQDIRFGWRQLVRTPGFASAAVLALAMGIGATTAVYTVLDRVVLRPLPYADPDRLTMVWEVNQAKGLTHENLSPVNFMDYRGVSQAFSDAAAWWKPQVNLTETGRDPLRVGTVEASGNFFAVVGVQPTLGGGFPRDEFFSRDHIAVISHRLWRDRFASDPAIIGRQITLSDVPYAVAGVMPPGFQFPGDTDVWERLQWDLTQHSRAAHFMEAVFRLKPGVTIDAAGAELRALTARLAQEHPATNGGWSARPVLLASEVVGFFRPALFALFGAAALLLVITCTNVASLLLARATVREREVAVRAAVGASRGRLVRQLLTESALLASLGTALGLAVAAGAVRTLTAVSPIDVPRLQGVGIDGRVLMFAVALACLTAVAFGVGPALFMARGDMNRPLKDAGRGADGGGRRRLRSVLVVAEVALAVMLLVGAALLARSFERLVGQNPGFQPARVVTANLELPFSYSDFRKIADFYGQLLTSIRAQPGVEVAGATNVLPLQASWRLPVTIEGRPAPRKGDELQVQHQTVDDEYFRCLGVGLLKGRFFDARDTVDAPGVVLINEALARREWPDADPVGQRVMTGVRYIGPLGTMLMPPNTRFQIVGVVANLKNASLVDAPEPAVYFTFRQFPFRGMHIVVQGAGGSSALVGAVRSSVQRLDPRLPLAQARDLEQVVADATDRPRALMLLMVVFAALALALAALGIYSVLSYAVSQRRQELSVRMALGARPADVLWLVVRQGLGLAALGGVAGALGAIALGRTLSSLLFGVSTVDSLAFGVAVALVLGTALVACLIPARRAARIGVLDGLRAE